MLLQLARNIFTEQTNLDGLVTKIMVDSQEVMKCQRCSILLVESEDTGVRNSLETFLVVTLLFLFVYIFISSHIDLGWCLVCNFVDWMGGGKL